MPSKEHQALQLAIVGHIGFEYQALNDSNIVSLCVDNHSKFATPEEIEGHRPDVYYRDPSSTMCIIGVATTSSDLDNTKEQLHAYFKYLINFKARKKNKLGVLVLATPLASKKDAFQILGEIGAIYSYPRSGVGCSGGQCNAMMIERCFKDNILFSNDTDLFKKFSEVSLVEAIY